jgi:chromosome segregation ATPase
MIDCEREMDELNSKLTSALNAEGRLRDELEEAKKNALKQPYDLYLELEKKYEEAKKEIELQEKAWNTLADENARPKKEMCGDELWNMMRKAEAQNARLKEALREIAADEHYCGDSCLHANKQRKPFNNYPTKEMRSESCKERTYWGFLVR